MSFGSNDNHKAAIMPEADSDFIRLKVNINFPSPKILLIMIDNIEGIEICHQTIPIPEN